MEFCLRCGRGEEEVRLLDAIYETQIMKICEECALIEDIPIIRRPTTIQLRESHKPYSVYERLKKISGVENKQDEISRIAQDMVSGKFSKDKKQEEDKWTRAKRMNKPLNLIDNFHWKILMERKRKKMTRKELGDVLGESEIAIKMIENKEMPDDADKLISKIEQYFEINLRKGCAEEVKEERKEPVRILKFDYETTKNIKIGDLVKMKQEREKCSQQESEEKKQIMQEKSAEESSDKEDKNEKRYTPAMKLKQKFDINKMKEPEKITDMVWQLKKNREEQEKDLLGEDIELED